MLKKIGVLLFVVYSYLYIQTHNELQLSYVKMQENLLKYEKILISCLNKDIIIVDKKTQICIIRDLKEHEITYY